MWTWDRSGGGRLPVAEKTKNFKYGKKTTKRAANRRSFLLGAEDHRGCGDNGRVKSWVEISGARLVANLRAVQAVVGDGVETLAVVKANGYGHDAALVARVLVNAGVHWLGVSDVEEGTRLRAELGVGPRLLVMCGIELADCKEVVRHGLTPVVWTVEHIAAFEALGQPVRVHLEIDTGMARQGVDLEGLATVVERLLVSKWVVCEGVLSHLSSAEEVGSAVTERQREKFGRALDVVVAMGVRPDWVHLGATSAVDEGSTMEWVRKAAESIGARAMVRTGFALYGHCLPLDTGALGALGQRLQPALTWKTRVIGVRTIHAGTTVGYGATFVAKSLMRLALLPIGYADGFRRAGSSGLGNGWVMIAGQKAAVVGRVSMNLMTVDVTHIAGVAVGEEVVLLGEGCSAEDQAGWSGTIAYDILCGIRAKFVLN
jgi:alanine racemase